MNAHHLQLPTGLLWPGLRFDLPGTKAESAKFEAEQSTKSTD